MLHLYSLVRDAEKMLGQMRDAVGSADRERIYDLLRECLPQLRSARNAVDYLQFDVRARVRLKRDMEEPLRSLGLSRRQRWRIVREICCGYSTLIEKIEVAIKDLDQSREAERLHETRKAVNRARYARLRLAEITLRSQHRQQQEQTL